MVQVNPKAPEILGCAYVVPLSQMEYEQHYGMKVDDEVEAIAMNIAIEYEAANEWQAEDVSSQNLGYDIRSVNKLDIKRYIEVKGRSGIDGVMLSENEMNRLAQLGNSAWLYIVVNCKSKPQLHRIQNPAKKLIFERKDKGVQYYLPLDEWEEIKLKNKENINMTKAKKLIEVAMPIKEISAESVRDKSIRHGHISTLHLWWARRPLPVCRAVIFASLVPDPLDEQCPLAFKDAIQELLSNDPLYVPYPDIPYTAIYDPMPDNLRNRLLMFIGKFSPVCQANMLKSKSTASKEQLSEGCLIKWESKNDKAVLAKARKLIWVAYNAEQNPDASFISLSQSFDAAYQAIEEAENNLYTCIDRHLETDIIKEKEAALKTAIDCFQKQMPSVFDPFAGGGAIPLETARLGCRSYGNDINPVAHIIEKGSVEFPQKYGKPIRYTEEEFRRIYGKEGIDILITKGISICNGIIDIPNRLSFDVEYYAKQLLAMTEKEVGYLYPADENGNKPIAYYWARTATCSNPSCKAEVPLLKQFYLANTSSKKVYLNPVINGTDIQFEIKEGMCPIKSGWNNRGNMTCPCCGSITTVNQVKLQFKAKTSKEVLLAIISETNRGKLYRLPTKNEYIKPQSKNIDKPTDRMAVENNRNFNTPGWGIEIYGDMFSDRQLFMLQAFTKSFSLLKKKIEPTQYTQALYTYLAIWID